MQNITEQNIGIEGKITGLLEKYPVILQILSFGAIGVFNTAMDVLVLNFMSAQFSIHKGVGIGWVNFPGFILAVVQSYFWNKYWAFSGEQQVGLLKNFLRLLGVGITGFIVYVLLILGAHESVGSWYFLLIFAIFILAQVVLWFAYGFSKLSGVNTKKHPVVSFFVVSFVGFVINSTVLYFATTNMVGVGNTGDNLNIAKLLATLFSLIWNFIGYKIIVFKK